MSERNTWFCSGCKKPFSSERVKDQHESTCSLADTEETEADAEPSMEDQDQQFRTPPDPVPEEQPAPEPEVESRPPDRKAVDFGGGSCQCCGSDVGSTTRKGMCYGCDLAGCSPDSHRCQHRSGGGSSA